jgi:hypothetical protein
MYPRNFKHLGKFSDEQLIDLAQKPSVNMKPPRALDHALTFAALPPPTPDTRCLVHLFSRPNEPTGFLGRRKTASINSTRFTRKRTGQIGDTRWFYLFRHNR